MSEKIIIIDGKVYTRGPKPKPEPEKIVMVCPKKQKGRTNARPMLHPKMADGLRKLAETVKAIDSPELIKAARYCSELADYLQSEAYKELSEKQEQRALKSKLKNGVKLSKNQTAKAKELGLITEEAKPC